MKAVQAGISIADYLEMEFNAMERHEYVEGKIRLMPYASENHRHICHNINRLLGNFYLEREENVFTNQTLVFFDHCERGYYPDITVFPPDIEYRDYRGKMKAALNPLVVVEVLSDSTEHVDRGEKWLCYQTIPSLRQYVLVSQNAMIVETYTRAPGSNEWHYQSFEGENALVPIGDGHLPMKEIYRKVVFEPAAEEETEQ